MNEEKKLSQMLDEIFGDYINNEIAVIDEESDSVIEALMQSKENNLKLDFYIPKIDAIEHAAVESAVLNNLTNLIDNLFSTEDIINETDLSFNRFAVKPVPPIAPPVLAKTLIEKPEINNEEQKVEIPQKSFHETKRADSEEHLTSTKQAYIAKAVCNQIYELFYVYNKLIRSSRRFRINTLQFFKEGLREIKPIAEYIYEKIASQNIYYFHENINFNNEESALLFIKNKINAILSDAESLKNSVEHIDLKDHLAQIKALLSFQLETINNL